MRLYAFIFLAAMLCIFAGGCHASAYAPLKEISSYSEKSIQTARSCGLDMRVDAASIEIYTWDEARMKFEITKKVRGISKDANLEMYFNRFNINIESKDKNVIFESAYKNTFRKKAEGYLGLRIYIPRKTGSISCQLDDGSITIFDDVKSNICMKLGAANADIRRLKGCADITCRKGNISIGSGRLGGETSIRTENGSIKIKSEFDEAGSYIFEANRGNIDIMAPEQTKLTFQTAGPVDSNDFMTGEYDVRAKVTAKLGRISIKKY